jgi:hypothetical protein
LIGPVHHKRVFCCNLLARFKMAGENCICDGDVVQQKVCKFIYMPRCSRNLSQRSAAASKVHEKMVVGLIAGRCIFLATEPLCFSSCGTEQHIPTSLLRVCKVLYVHTYIDSYLRGKNKRKLI